MSRSGPDERGVVAVELALLLPFLVLMVWGIIEFSRGYNAKVTVTHSAREGVRAYALDEDPVTAAKNAAGSLDPNSLTVTVSGAQPCTTGEQVSVTVSYPIDYEIPFFGGGTWTVSDTGTMRCEAGTP
ncbi:MAG: pilus assembly protein [Acidimicrobiia bacterium]|nr:pilus assembly protein [Acidimicrobiia bacterium]